ncbi:cobyrinate a,c-diamide synthase [Dermacoccus barathri]|nr:cobyrinate a,c-diamide synthase [Dermacoccus barathri]
MVSGSGARDSHVLPRVVLAAPSSGQGKTTVSVGVMAALAARGLNVAPAKVGPDFIDPGYHALATGRVGRNLDPWMQGEERIAPLLLAGAHQPDPADVAVIEGVMGLFDGRLGTDGFASTAHVARLTQSPVVLVVDISSASRSVAAVVHGLRSFDPRLDVAGVILNKAGSPRHADEVRRACAEADIRVLGSMPRDAGVSVPSRHLGLVPAEESADARATLDHLARATAEHIDLDALLEVARAAAPLEATPWTPPARQLAPGDERPRVAVAGGRAFTFRYAETDELLRAQGLEPVVFDPVTDEALPEGTRGLYLGGGFPEVHAAALAKNRSLLNHVAAAVRAGVPTVAECAGMLYLLAEVDGHRFADVIDARATMSPRLTLGYREAIDPAFPDNPPVRGHEFHRTVTEPRTGGQPAWEFDGAAEGFALDPAGAGHPTVHASYLHTHWAGAPERAVTFADAVHAGPQAPSAPGAHGRSFFSGETPVGNPTLFHGDDELDEALIDFAVNVRAAQPPADLTRHLASNLSGLAAYPRADAARDAVAARHGVAPHQVLLTNGAAEAFTLISRGLEFDTPLVVHPQFSEPDAALKCAGHRPRPHIVRTWLGESLDSVPDDADLVVVGNPTNPTGALHSRAELLALRRPGRILVVDEAFMDLVPGEHASLVNGPVDDVEGLLVVRSLTKTWSIAGLRAGYLVGDTELVALCSHAQPHWSVNTLAAEAAIFTTSPSALRQVAEWAVETEQWREHLVDRLRALGLDPLPSCAPFVTVEVGTGVHARLREEGFATRRCETFPGLGPEWIRLAVRDPLTTDALLAALGRVLQRTGEADPREPRS